MIDLLNVQAVILDHSYCKPAKFEAEFSSILEEEESLLKMADTFLSDWKDEIGVEFDPPTEVDAPLSSLSPSHSVDSGFEHEMNFLSEFGDIDLDGILNSDMNANLFKEQTSDTSKALPPQPSTSKTNCKTAPKTEVLTDVEKSKKNAIAARENRIKKKKYVESIEGELQKLRKENEILKNKEKRHDQVVDKLREEVSYLKNVLTNQSTLSTLVNRLVTTPGISFNLTPEEPSTSKTANHDDDDDNCTDDAKDDDVDIEIHESQSSKGNAHTSNQNRYQTRGTKRKAATSSPMAPNPKKSQKNVKGGVCLHLGQDMVSLTFCSQCSSNVSGKTGN